MGKRNNNRRKVARKNQQPQQAKPKAIQPKTNPVKSIENLNEDIRPSPTTTTDSTNSAQTIVVTELNKIDALETTKEKTMRFTIENETLCVTEPVFSHTNEPLILVPLEEMERVTFVDEDNQHLIQSNDLILEPFNEDDYEDERYINIEYIQVQGDTESFIEEEEKSVIVEQKDILVSQPIEQPELPEQTVSDPITPLPSVEQEKEKKQSLVETNSLKSTPVIPAKIENTRSLDSQKSNTSTTETLHETKKHKKENKSKKVLLKLFKRKKDLPEVKSIDVEKKMKKSKRWMFWKSVTV